MASIPFVKAHGCGNDFIVVDLRAGRPAAGVQPAPDSPEVAKALCDRHFGIGADGVLAILPGVTGDARMRVINADGSEAEMCGNGIRCVTKVLYEKDPGLRRPVLHIDTGAGPLDCAIDAPDGRVATVAVEMGRPRLGRAEIPMLGSPEGEPVVRASLRARDREFTYTAVSMGNPHAVVFVDEPGADLRALAEAYGPAIERHGLFPRRTNVELARVRAGASGPEIDLVVWERGCGITLACGTGACATVVAACLEGRVEPGREIPVRLLGGTLAITVRPPTTSAPNGFSGVTMRGPAEIVFEAEVDTSEALRRAREGAVAGGGGALPG